MLDRGNAAQLIDQFWQTDPRTAQLPEELAESFARRGQLKPQYDERRRFTRFFLRGKAVLGRDNELCAIYTKDISRAGLGFYHYEQVFPLERLRVWLPNGSSPKVIVRRCRRIAEQCYECAVEFETENDSSPTVAHGVGSGD